MSRNLFPLALTATMLAGTAMAEVPRVAATSRRCTRSWPA